MAEQTEIRRVNGGMDTVSAPVDIKDGAFLNAVNFRTVAAQEGQQAGFGNIVAGNIEVQPISAILPGGTNTLIGKTAAPERNSLYLFFEHASVCSILEYNALTDTARVVINDTKVTGGLGFTADMFISARVSGDQLIWANGVTDIRYADLTVDYMAGAAITLGQLSILTEPPAIPLEATRDDVPGATSIIQARNVQFTYRFSNTSGFYSVLAPYSLTSFATRETDIAGSADAGNAIDVVVPFAQSVPSDWRYIDLVARYPDTAETGFFIIKRWDVANATDVAEVAAHNASATPLTLQNWTGAVIETLDDAYTSKQFDLAPLSAAAIELAANRLVLGGIVEGYDNVTAEISMSVTPHTYNAIPPTPNPVQVWIVFVKQYNVDKHYFAVVVRYQNINYLLPEESSIGSFEYGVMPNPSLIAFNSALDVTPAIFSLPSHMHVSALTRLSETGDFVDANPSFPTGGVGPATLTVNPTTSQQYRQAIVVEANKLTGFQSQRQGDGVSFDHWLVPYANIIIDDDAGSTGLGGERRAFMPGATYNIGVQFYDAALRRPGRNIVTSVDIPEKVSMDGEFVERITVTPSLDSGTIPDWAAYFSVVMSKNQLTSRVIEYVTGLVKLAIVENGETVFRGVDQYPVYPLSSIKGIAFPITSLASANYGYEYQAGDVIQYAYEDGSSTYISGTLRIRSVEGGYIIAYDDVTQHTQIAAMIAERFTQLHLYWDNLNWQTTIEFTDLPPGALRPKIICRILSRNQSDQEYYEVAAFGEIVGAPGAKDFGNFYDSGTPSIDIYGDMHLQSRQGISGSATVVSMLTNEQNTLLWITDSGRTTPADTIGQQSLPSAIRWSNIHIPGGQVNGFGSFDALDIKFVEQTAGPIRSLMLTTRNQQDGGQMLVLCENGSFVGPVGQQQLSDQNGNANLAIAATVFGTFNMLSGEYGCSSPRSVCRWQNHVWWVDTIKREVVEFNDGGAGSIAGMGMTRLFRETLERIVADGDTDQVSAGVNPYTRELILTMPASNPFVQPSLRTVSGFEDPFNAYVNKPSAWFFNYEANRWQSRYSSGGEFMNVADNVFSWQDGKLWHEFVGDPGDYYGTEQDAVIAISFNAGYPTIKTPVAIRVVSEQPPTAAWVMCNGDGRQHVAGVQAFSQKEDYWRADIRRDRTSGGGNTEDEWKMAGAGGATLKGSVVFVVLIFEPGQAPINLSSVSVEWNSSKGQAKSSG